MNGVIVIRKLTYLGIFSAMAVGLTACIGVDGPAPEIRVGPAGEATATTGEEATIADDDSILEVDIDPVFTDNAFIGLTFDEAKVLATDLGFSIYHQRADVATDSIKDDSKWVAVRLDEDGLVEWAKVPG